MYSYQWYGRLRPKDGRITMAQKKYFVTVRKKSGLTSREIDSVYTRKCKKNTSRKWLGDQRILTSQSDHQLIEIGKNLITSKYITETI